MNTVDSYEMPLNFKLDPKGNVAMLLHEDLARTRMRESQRTAEQQRLARRLGTARRWQRLATWAGRHAASSARAVGSTHAV